MSRGEVPAGFWRSGKQFLLTPDNQVWEKEGKLVYAWDCWKGEYQRDNTLPPLRWTDLVKERAPVITVTPTEAVLVLIMKRIEEVNKVAETPLNPPEGLSVTGEVRPQRWSEPEYRYDQAGD